MDKLFVRVVSTGTGHEADGVMKPMGVRAHASENLGKTSALPPSISGWEKAEKVPGAVHGPAEAAKVSETVYGPAGK